MLSNTGLERAIIAGICQYGLEAFEDVDELIEGNSSSFTSVTNQALYSCLKEIITNKENIDISSLSMSISRLGYDKLLLNTKKDYEYLGSLFNFTVSKDNIPIFAKRLEKLNIARKAISKHQEAINKLKEIDGSEKLEDIIHMSEDPIFDLINELNKGKDDGPHRICDKVDELIEYLIANKGKSVGLETPWPIYNTAIGGGLRRGGVNLIGSRMKIGKTTLAKETILYLTSRKIPVLMLDTEMIIEDQIVRSLASMSRVEISKIESGEFDDNYLDKTNIFKACDELKDNKYFWYESIAGKHFDTILSIIRRWIIRNVGYDDNGNVKNCLVVYDYFKIMDDSELNSLQEYQVMGFQISKLTDFCKEYDFACLAFVQLNRQHDISQSDRLRWLCHSYSTFAKKEPEEIAGDGPHNGNRKLKVLDTRFGAGINDNDHINVRLEGRLNKVTELTLHSNQPAEAPINDSRFEIEENVI